MTRRVRIGSEQSGVSLILVLATLTIFGLLVPVLGQFGSVNGVSAYVVKGQRFDRYAADSAMQGAIAWAQQTRTAGRANVPCPAVGTGVLNSESANFQRSASVVCQGFKGSGVPQETPTMPKYAVLALGTDGTGIRAIGSGALTTGGAWWSNSAPTAVGIGGGVDLDATKDFVGGIGTCPNVDAAPTMCGRPDQAVEPAPTGGAWTPAVGSIADVPIQDPFGEQFADGDDPCDAVGSDRTLDLEPGFYWDIDGLNAVGHGCPGGPITIRFEPGPYYFDFDFFDDQNTSPNSTAWVVDGDVTLVSGEGTNELGNCQPGVELTFGSTSHLRIVAPASADICPLSGLGQKMSIVGLTEGEEVKQPVRAQATAVDAVPEPNFAFEWPYLTDPPTPRTLRDADCLDVEGDCPDGSVVGGRLTGRRATELVRMRVPDPMPDGVRPERFILSITHAEHEDQPNDLASLTVRVTGLPPGVECDLSEAQDVRPSFDVLRTDEFPCTVQSGRAYDRAGDLTVAYEFGTGNRPDAAVGVLLDQVELTAEYTPPYVRAESGCVTNTTCQLLEVDQRDGGGEVFVAGTVFAPQAQVLLRGGGADRTGLTRGVVVRSIVFADLPDEPGFTPVSLPGGGAYTDRLVTFEAKLDDGDDPSTMLSARVRFCDPQPEEGAHADDRCTDPLGGPPLVVAWEPKR